VPEVPGASPFGTFDTARPGPHMHGAYRAAGQIGRSGCRPPAEADMSWPSRSRPGLAYPVDGGGTMWPHGPTAPGARGAEHRAEKGTGAEEVAS